MFLLRGLVVFSFLSFTFAVLPNERNALVDFYNSLDGPKWTNNLNWLTSDPCKNSWSGVTCDSFSSTVLTLTRNSQSLDGTIPMSMVNLSNLQVLSLNDNPELEGPIPSFYENLQFFETLEISFNGISGNLPTKLGNTPNLQSLYLNSNQFSGTIPDDMFGVAPYKIMYLFANQITGTIPDSFCKSPSTLTNLNFGINQLTGSIPDCLDNFPNLETLSIGKNNLTGTFPLSVSKMPSLITLDFSENNLTGPLPEMLSTTLLNSLALEDNSLTGTIPDYSQNYSPFGVLEMNVENNQLTGTIPDWICNLNFFFGDGNDFGCPHPDCCAGSSFSCGECT